MTIDQTQITYIDEKEGCGFLDSVPVVPQSWYHICVGIDTISGNLRIVDNGVIIVDEEKEYFRNTASSIKPESIAGNLLGKSMFMLSSYIYIYI